MNTRAISTAESRSAVNNIKSMVKRTGLGLSFEPSAESKAKKIYMQSDEFLHDPHNEQMFTLFDVLICLRDKITKNIQEMNTSTKDVVVQGINGFARKKSELDANPQLNYAEYQTFFSPTDNLYSKIKNVKIKDTANEIRQQLEQKI